MRKVLRKQVGFSLMELLIVIGIIVVLAAILFPVFARSKQSAWRVTALSQAKQLGTALTLYIDQNDGKYLPSTNYGLPDSDPNKMWQNGLIGLAKDQKIFIAPGSDGTFAENWNDRGRMSIGYSSATAIDKSEGCAEDQANTSGCIAFKTVAEFTKEDDTAAIALFAVTPDGPTENKYRGYEFSPYNGSINTEHPKLSPPLVSDRDLVKEMTLTQSLLSADALKPVYCRYLSTGSDDGYSPVIFADGHAKDYSAKQIAEGTSNIVWRFR